MDASRRPGPPRAPGSQ